MDHTVGSCDDTEWKYFFSQRCLAWELVCVWNVPAKYIFPSGCPPRVSRVNNSRSSEASMLVVVSRAVVRSGVQLTRVQTGHQHRVVRMVSTANTWISGPFNWVQGERSAPADVSPGFFDNVSPRTDRLLSKVPRSGDLEINRAVAAARSAFPAWSALSG